MSRPIVTSWTFFETGTFENQGSRNYRAKNFGDDVVDRILSNTQGGARISSSALNGVVGDILELDQKANTNIYIPNGWDTERLAFICELLLDEGSSNERRQILTGYTDKADLTYNDTLDPETQLFINNSFILNSFEVGGRGGRRRKSRVMANDFIIRSAEDQTGDRRGRRGRDKDVEVLLRSEDVFYKRDTRAMTSNSRTDVRDGRLQLTGELKLGRRADTNASDYLASILKIGVASERKRQTDDYHFGDIDTDTAPMFQRSSVDEIASGYTRAGSLDDHGIFRDWLTDTDFANCGMIELRDFESAVKVECEASVLRPGRVESRKYQRHHRGDNAEWGGGNREDIVPDMVKNTLVSLLLRYTIAEARVIITNQTQLGEMTCHISNAKSLIQDFDVEPMLDDLELIIQNDLGMMVSRNNLEDITVDVDYNMLSSMLISVDHHDGHGEIRYNAAIFADGLQTNLRADDEDILDQIVNDTDDLISEIIENGERSRR
jgi:hypothetical protein